MIAEAIAKICELTRQGEKPHVIQVSERKNILAVGDKLRDLEYEPRPRHHAVDGLEEILKLIAMQPDSEKCVVWVGGAYVHLIFDDTDRLDHAKLHLEISPQLRLLETAKEYTQKELVKLLRLQSFGSMTPDITSSVASLKWSQTSGGGAAVSHGRESISKELLAQVEGAAEAVSPEVVCSVPVFGNPTLRTIYHSVQCAVFLDPDSCRIQIKPLCGETDRALQGGQNQIMGQLDQMLEAAGELSPEVLRGEFVEAHPPSAEEINF